jgi:anti-sigma regulatory factor (Ser/Thr protein kinase)
MPKNRHPHTPPPPGPFEYRFAPSVSAIRLARQVLAGWLELQPGADRVAVDDLVVVCSELVTNAVRHSRHDDAMVSVRAAVDDDGVVLEVEDPGPGFAWPTDRVLADIGVADEGGRGLLIAQALTDVLEVRAAQGAGTVVRCVKLGVLREDRHADAAPAHVDVAAARHDREDRDTASAGAAAGG